MTTPNDPLGRLRAAAQRQRDEIAVDPDLVNEALAQVEPRRQRPSQPRRGRRRVAIGVAALVVGVGAGAAAAFFINRQPGRPEAALACYNTSSLDGDAWVMSATDDPVDACAQLWADGKLPDIDDPRGPGQSVPPLVACVTEYEHVAVLVDPGGGCSEIGLDAAAELDDESRRIIEMSDRAIETINLPECVTVADAEAMLSNLLDEFDFDWAIERDDRVTDESCAVAVVDSPSETITLFEKPPPPQPPTEGTNP